MECEFRIIDQAQANKIAEPFANIALTHTQKNEATIPFIRPHNLLIHDN